MGTGRILRSVFKERINTYIEAVKKHFPKGAYEDLPIIQILHDSEKYYYDDKQFDSIPVLEKIELLKNKLCKKGLYEELSNLRAIELEIKNSNK